MRSRAPTHAYVGYNKDGRPVMVFADTHDTRSWRANEGAKVIRAGGTVERVTMVEAQKVASRIFKGSAA